ncbi:MAG: 4-(cytidine 5'-diphospho)-2-C-methyl-D-erythritol kinase [Rhodobacteraceae bacterium]|nr:4-(cytidine 5'-diphospho)-2-C-methyl-D-erythritol kinase [Paracoccaceae bacterium]
MTGAITEAIIAETTSLAPAKVNLALHVVGKGDGGYHLLDSLMAFAHVGEKVIVRPAQGLSLLVRGPQARGVPTSRQNLALRAAVKMGARDLALTLEKHIPPAAGLGGGSSDAAATMRALAQCQGLPFPADRGRALGADVPACLLARAVRVRGTGEIITPMSLPPLPAVLVNPGVALPTAQVFQTLRRKQNAPLPALPRLTSVQEACRWFSRQRNDLQTPAMGLAPVIADALAALSSAPLARMSGSGATCFAICVSRQDAQALAYRVQAACPAWWVRATMLCQV